MAGHSRELTDVELREIADKIGKEWQRLGIFLGYSTPQIEKLKLRNEIHKFRTTGSLALYDCSQKNKLVEDVVGCDLFQCKEVAQ